MAYTDVEIALYNWFRERDLYPGKLGIGDVQDLAERVTKLIRPFRSLHRSYKGHTGYEDTLRFELEAREAEKDLLAQWDKKDY